MDFGGRLTQGRPLTILLTLCQLVAGNVTSG